MGIDFNFNDISEDLIDPQTDDKPKWSNKMAYVIDVLREQFLVKQIETRLNKYKNILVVCAPKHLMRHRLMLNKVFGESSDMSI